MPVLKDVECTACERRVEMLVDGDVTEMRLVCLRCKKPQTHRTICCGGVKAPIFTEGVIMAEIDKHVELVGVKAGVPRPEHIDTPLESKTATPEVYHPKHKHAGRALHEMPRFQRDAIQARREKRRSNHRRQRGRAPLFFGPTSK